MPTRLVFGPFLLDSENETLFRGEEPLAVGKRAVALLRVLIEHGGAPVSKDILMDAVWSGLAVEESNLSVQVAALRRVLGTAPGGDQWIETLPRRGYRYVGPPVADAREPPHPPRERQSGPAPAAVTGTQVLRPAPGSEALVGASAERRQLTILACEFVGATALSMRLDTEDFRNAMRRLHDECRHIVESDHGRVASLLPDGIVAYFGEPHPTEHDAEYAVRAGLELVNSAGLDDAVGASVRCRIGIATGAVILEEMVAGGPTPERLAVGEASNLAQELKAAADPGAVLIGENTRALVGGLFEYREIAPVTLEGHGSPVRAWQVVGAGPRESRFAARQGIDEAARQIHTPVRPLTPFVGRDREMEILKRFRAQAAQGLFVVDIVGEPGLGKSRLLHEFRRWLMESRVFVLSGSCWPDSQHTALRPFVEVTRRVCRIGLADREDEIARKLENGLAFLGLLQPENLGLLMNLLGLKPPRDALAGLHDALIGSRTRDLLLRLVRERARIAPLALLLEDLHWIDAATRDLIAHGIASESAFPILVVNTYRPEYRPPWAGRERTAALMLEPLGSADTTRIVEARLSGEACDPSIIGRIVDKAEGNPLFAEEIANFVVERPPRAQRGGAVQELDGGRLPELPASVQALLASRVGRLGRSDRGLLAAAAAIGREFSPDLLGAVTQAPPDLATRLSAMQELDLIHQDMASGQFVFKHALVRDALYDTLLAESRSELHRAIATEIERRSAARLIEVAEVLAQHYVLAGSTDKAIEFATLAATKSLGIYSLDEAEQFLRRALRLVRPNTERPLDERALNIIADLARVLTLQFKSRDVVALVEPESAAVLASVEYRQTPPLLYFYGFALFGMCRFAEARRALDEALRIAERQRDPRGRAYAAAGLFFLSNTTQPLPVGEFRALAQRALADAEAVNDVHLFATTVMSVGWNYTVRGLAAEGRQNAEALLRFGRERRDGRSIGSALWLLAWIDLLTQDYVSALQHGEEAVAAASTQADRMMGRLMLGCAQVLSGKAREGMELISGVRDDAEANHWPYLFAVTDAPMGVALVLTGQIKAGLALLHALVRRGESEYANLAGVDFARLFLAEIYISLVIRDRPVPLRVVIRNLLPLLRARMLALRTAERLLATAMKSELLSPDGVFRARLEYDLGRLETARGNPHLAREHFERARAAAAQQNAAVMLDQIEAELRSPG